MIELLLVLHMLGKEPSADEICKRSIVFLEARGEPLRGQKAVRQTLTNRARINGTSACKEAKRRGQFSSVKKGMKLRSIKPDRNFLTGYKKVRIMRKVVPACTTSFHTRAVRPYWVSSKRKVAEINNHVFYCDKEKK